MFDSGDGRTGPPPRLTVGAADRHRLVDHLGGLYFRMRHSRREVLLGLAGIEDILAKGGPIPQRLLDGLARYQVARERWIAGYQTVIKVYGAEVARRIWEDVKVRHGGDGAEHDRPPEGEAAG